MDPVTVFFIPLEEGGFDAPFNYLTLPRHMAAHISEQPPDVRRQLVTTYAGTINAQAVTAACIAAFDAGPTASHEMRVRAALVAMKQEYEFAKSNI